MPEIWIDVSSHNGVIDWKKVRASGIVGAIIREVRQTAKKKSWNPHNCKSILSYLGWFQHTDNYKMYQQWVKPYINVRRMKGVVRRESIKRCNAGKGFSGAA